MVNLIVRISSIFSAGWQLLQYSNSLRVVRATQTNSINVSTSGTGVLIKNTDDWTNNYRTGVGGNATFVVEAVQMVTTLSINLSNAAHYEQEGATTVNDGSTAVGDTVVVAELRSKSKCRRYNFVFNYSTTNDYDDGEQYRVTNIATNDVTIVQH